MTNLFQEMQGGQFFGSLFFVLLVIAGGTSTIAAIEVLATTLTEHLPIRRGSAVWGMVAFAFVTNAVVIMFQGPWSGPRLFGRDLFTFIDYLSGTVLLPISALSLAVYVSVGWTFRRFRAEANVGSGWVKVGPPWGPFVRLLIPIAVALVFPAGVGVI